LCYNELSMTEDDKAIILHISATLDKILGVLAKPESKVRRILEIVAAGITILGILSAIDIIRNWLGG